MKKTFESPKLEICEFVVAARLDGSGFGAHSNSANNSACSRAASNGINSCAVPASYNSGIANAAC